MIQEDKNNKILELQCKHGVFASKLAKALSVGQCSKELLNKNTFVAFNIELLRRFVPFKSVITNGYKITFTKQKKYNNITISIGVNNGVTITTLASYSGNASLEYILYYLQNIINNGTSSHNYIAEVKDNILYLYSYDLGESFTYTLDLSFSDGIDNDSIEIISKSIENITLELLDIWNCISLEDFDKMYKCILNEYKIDLSYLEEDTPVTSEPTKG